jgi:hypothetical protein
MENDELRSKLEKFMSAKIPIHIVLKKKPGTDLPRFLNGLILNKKAEDIFIIEERKLGKTYVFLEDIYDVSVFVKNNRALAEEAITNNGFMLGEGVSKDEINLIKDIKDEDES